MRGLYWNILVLIILDVFYFHYYLKSLRLICEKDNCWYIVIGSIKSISLLDFKLVILKLNNCKQNGC